MNQQQEFNLAFRLYLKYAKKLHLFYRLLVQQFKNFLTITIKCMPLLPVALEKFTTRPRAFFNDGRKILVTSIIPHRFTSARRLKMSIGVHSIGRISRIPALFTRPHNPVVSVEQRVQVSQYAQTRTAVVCTGFKDVNFSVFR